jgi:hypothetical protein
MSKIIIPGSPVLYMKVGVHADESLASIITRKKREIKEAGFGMWGYGGNTCHPSSMVQPFASQFAAAGKVIHLCMQEIESKHFAKGVAAEFSEDGTNWQEIPPEIEVRGSRYALVVNNLREEAFSLPLNKTRVPIGPSTGKIGGQYIGGRVDKACLEVLEDPVLLNTVPDKTIDITLVAELEAPYAVFLRGER